MTDSLAIQTRALTKHYGRTGEIKALTAARDSVIAFNERSLPQNWTAKNKHGAKPKLRGNWRLVSKQRLNASRRCGVPALLPA